MICILATIKVKEGKEDLFENLDVGEFNMKQTMNTIEMALRDEDKPEQIRVSVSESV